MPRMITAADGTLWEVGPSGRHTQYAVDEFTLEFVRTDDGRRERRFARFSPRGAKAAEVALEEASDAALTALLRVSQPAWTSPDGGYAGPV